MTTIETSNTEQIASIFDAFNRGDVATVLAKVNDHARFVSHLDPIVPWSGEFADKDQIGGYFQALGGSVEIMDHPVSSIVAQGDTVVATGEVSFRVRATGRAGSSSWVYIFKLANGMVESFDQFNDAGLAEAFR